MQGPESSPVPDEGGLGTARAVQLNAEALRQFRNRPVGFEEDRGTLVDMKPVDLLADHAAAGPVGGFQHHDIDVACTLKKRVGRRQPGRPAPDDNDFRPSRRRDAAYHGPRRTAHA